MLVSFGCAQPTVEDAVDSLTPGSRVLVDAHNCYPYQGRWQDRLERALGTGLPVAIEQDLYWYEEPESGRAWSVVSHGDEVDGSEPTLDEHFVQRVAPLVRAGSSEDRRGDWPLIVLNLDFKTEEVEHLESVWELLETHESWLTTATCTLENLSRMTPLEPGPILVLTGSSTAQEEFFITKSVERGRYLLFGAVRGERGEDGTLRLEGEPSGYRRWFNAPWDVIEQGGPDEAGEWTEAEEQRLREMVQTLQQTGLWVRFYTLNGVSAKESERLGWGSGYNFGSLEAVRLRWDAAISAGVDFIATDQYEQLADRIGR